eukprot:TRINITY_DN18276_c0_g1_i1.p1 TRINITY_DN18276_c0_g1~~TRINITY_DN18276_c0_g1_i1.p1  ORF type:complete len:510 (+),score=132.91 TRINITY_DN18276_c0_g1_i1:84-1613(+)
MDYSQVDAYGIIQASIKQHIVHHGPDKAPAVLAHNLQEAIKMAVRMSPAEAQARKEEHFAKLAAERERDKDSTDLDLLTAPVASEEQARTEVFSFEAEERLGAVTSCEAAARVLVEREGMRAAGWLFHDAQQGAVEQEEVAGRRSLAEECWGDYDAIKASMTASADLLALHRAEAHQRNVVATVADFERASAAAAAAALLVQEAPQPAPQPAPRLPDAAVAAAMTIGCHAAALPLGERTLLAEAMQLRNALCRSRAEVAELQTRLRGQHPQGARALLALDDAADGIGQFAPAEWALVARRGALAAREAKIREHRAWAMLAGSLYLVQATPGMLGHPNPGVYVQMGWLHEAKRELRDMREEVAEWRSVQRYTPFRAWIEKIDNMLEWTEMRRIEVGLLAREASLNARCAYTAYRALEPPGVAAAQLGAITAQPEWLPPLLQSGQPQGPPQQQHAQQVLPVLQFADAAQHQPRPRQARRAGGQQRCVTFGCGVGLGVFVALAVQCLASTKR